MADQLTIGKYQIQQLMKRGGMGVLYLGYDPELERQVAIKVIRTRTAGSTSCASASCAKRRRLRASATRTS